MNPDLHEHTVEHVREQLHATAPSLVLRGRGAEATMRRARHRRRRRQSGTAVLAAGALAVGGTVVVQRARQTTVPVTSGSEADATTTPPLAPLHLTWQSRPDGVGGIFSKFTAGSTGGVYGLSTAPGFNPPNPWENVRKAVYELAEDGTWTAHPMEGGAPDLHDVAAGDGLLYGAGTAPGSTATNHVPVLASSADHGQTWTKEQLAPATPPSTTVPWATTMQVAVEHVPGATLAAVTTSFTLPAAQVKAMAPTPELAEQAGPHRFGADGIEVLSRGVRPVDSVADLLNGGGTRSGSEVLYTIPWSQLGVSGADDIATDIRLLLRDGDRWTPVDAPDVAAGLSVYQVTTVGDEVVMTLTDGTFRPGMTRTAVASSDGRTWRTVNQAGFTGLESVGSTWVTASQAKVDPPAQTWARPDTGGNPATPDQIREYVRQLDGGRSPEGKPILQISEDRGATWQDKPLETIDARLATGYVMGIDSGPLGLAFVVEQQPDKRYLVTSRDLRTWSVTPMSEITPEPVTARAVVVGNDRIVLVASKLPMSTRGPEQLLTLVGTPTR